MVVCGCAAALSLFLVSLREIKVGMGECRVVDVRVFFVEV
jgi:hypothetical protein